MPYEDEQFELFPEFEKAPPPQHPAVIEAPFRGDWFVQVWSKYPKKAGKEKAKALFRVSVKTEDDLKQIYQALENYIKSERVAKGYIQDGSRWFRASEWRSWIDYKENTNGTNHKGEYYQPYQPIKKPIISAKDYPEDTL